MEKSTINFLTNFIEYLAFFSTTNTVNINFDFITQFYNPKNPNYNLIEGFYTFLNESNFNQSIIFDNN
jgi:hypothetical protein